LGELLREMRNRIDGILGWEGIGARALGRIFLCSFLKRWVDEGKNY